MITVRQRSGPPGVRARSAALCRRTGVTAPPGLRSQSSQPWRSPPRITSARCSRRRSHVLRHRDRILELQAGQERGLHAEQRSRPRVALEQRCRSRPAACTRRAPSRRADAGSRSCPSSSSMRRSSSIRCSNCAQRNRNWRSSVCAVDGFDCVRRCFHPLPASRDRGPHAATAHGPGIVEALVLSKRRAA